LFPIKGQHFLDPGRLGGECLLFLEQAKHVPYSDTLRTITCGAAEAKSHGHPFACAWAEENGSLVGKVGQWATKACNTSPAWFSAQSLGFNMGKHRSAIIHIEFWDGGTLIADFNAPLAQLPRHSSLTCDLKSKVTGNKKKSTVSFQILDSREVTESRTIFFVRHGESAWNKGQDELNLHEMYRTTNHPLSETGRNQAENLGCRLAQAAKQRNPAVAPLLRPDVIYASPLTRAVQTAAISFGPLVMKLNDLNEIVLMANARERKNWGGADSRSTCLGNDVPRHALEELRKLYPPSSDNAGVVDTFTKMRFDTQEVQDNWWCEGSSESPTELAARLQEFMAQLIYSPHKTAVVVGHSHFFREVFRNFLAEELKNSKADFCHDLCNMKLSNCGVIRVDLDPRRGIEGGPIVRADLVLQSRLVVDQRLGAKVCCPAGDLGDTAQEFNADSVFDLRYPPAEDLAGLLGDSGKECKGFKRQNSSLPRSISRDSTAAGSDNPFQGMNLGKFKRQPSNISMISNPRRCNSNVSSIYSSVNGCKKGRNKIEWPDPHFDL
jgi:broad specificity phosphatase PhoE